jgi:hypothetical protein
MSIARDQVSFLPLLAGNLFAVAVVTLVFCAQFSGVTPLWLLQAPYFAVCAVAVLVLTPLELKFLHWLHGLVPNVFIEAVLLGFASTVVGIPGGILIGLIGIFGPNSYSGPDVGTFFIYSLLGGLTIAGACLPTALGGRLAAEVSHRFPRSIPILLALAIANVGVAVVFLITR